MSVVTGPTSQTAPVPSSDEPNLSTFRVAAGDVDGDGWCDLTSAVWTGRVRSIAIVATEI
jgi:hypothetical protein